MLRSIDLWSMTAAWGIDPDPDFDLDSLMSPCSVDDEFMEDEQ